MNDAVRSGCADPRKIAHVDLGAGTDTQCISERGSRSRGRVVSSPAVAKEDQGRSSGRPHILFLIDQLCEAGGAERVLLNMVRLLPKDKFRCSLATFKLDARVDLFREIPCPVHVVRLRRTYGWSGLRAAYELRALIRSQRVNIVHTFF